MESLTGRMRHGLKAHLRRVVSMGTLRVNTAKYFKVGISYIIYTNAGGTAGERNFTRPKNDLYFLGRVFLWRFINV